MDRQDHDELDPRTAELFSQLSKETEGLLVDSPSPSEIRRLGERRRTVRRTGYSAGALGLAVLATAGGLALRDGPVQAKPVVEAAASAPATALPSRTAAATPSVTPSASLPNPSATATGTSAPSAPAASTTTDAATSAGPSSTAVPSTVAPSAHSSTSGPAPSSAASTAGPTPSPAPSDGPTTAPTSKGGQPTWESVPASLGAGVHQDAQSTTLPQEPFSICQVDIDDIAAQTMLVRHFTSGDGRVNSYAVVLGYANKDQAVAARRIMRGWYTGCAARLKADGNEATQTKAVPLPLTGGLASAVDPVDGASYRKVAWGSAGTTPIEEQATIIQADNRVLWVVHNVTDRTDMGSTAKAQSWAEKLLS